MREIRKIRTLGVRSAFVGTFDVSDHEVSRNDVIAEGRQAWDAVLGSVTLGKFLLGFGSIGICERALDEARAHLIRRILYGKPCIEMPHIRSMFAEAFVRLLAMKLYAFRALDYVQVASSNDRRYLLFCAVQKVKVSTEGLRVLSLLSECIGAKGFEADTYFEMALRDAQLIPGLESSTHINLGLAAQFAPRYFDDEPGTSEGAAGIFAPPSVFDGESNADENPYLMQAHSGAIHKILFPDYLRAYESLNGIENVQLLARQAEVFREFTLAGQRTAPQSAHEVADIGSTLAQARCLATIAYAQLVAENASRFDIAPPVVSAIFQLLVGDLAATAMSLAPLPAHRDSASQELLRRLIVFPKSSSDDWNHVHAQATKQSVDKQGRK
jgi:acyl-CoA dehydrogenase